MLCFDLKIRLNVSYGGFKSVKSPTAELDPSAFQPLQTPPIYRTLA